MAEKSGKRRGFIAASPPSRHKPVGMIQHNEWVTYPDLWLVEYPSGGFYPFDEGDHSPWWIGRPAPLGHVMDMRLGGFAMFRFLIAPFQKSAASDAAPSGHVDPARQELERLFREDLAAHSQSIAQTRGAMRGADPVHA